MSEVEFVGCPSTEVDKVWPHVKDYIQNALERDHSTDYWDLTYIRENIDDQRNQLFIATVDREIKAAFITSINDFSRCRTLDIHWTGGVDIDTWLDTAWRGLQDFALAKGCHQIRGYGRRGWMRKLKIKPKTQLIWALDI